MNHDSRAAEILVEFPSRPGLSEVSLSAKDVVGRSAEAVDAAMGTIRGMAERIAEAAQAAAHRPAEVEIVFGIKMDAEAGALLAKSGVEGSLTVKIVWKDPTRASQS